MHTHPSCIVPWRHGCSCMALCLCPSYLISVPTPCLECVHASVHVLMSTWVPNSAPSPLHSYMETWVPVCDTVCMFQSVHLWSHTLFRMCTCISTCVYVHLTPHVSWTPLWIVTCKQGIHCVAPFVCCSHPASGLTPWLECVYASVHVFMSIWLPVSSQRLGLSIQKTINTSHLLDFHLQ